MNEVAQRQAAPLVQFKQDLQRLADADELALPDTVTFKAFRNAAVVAITDNPSILTCKRETIFRAIRTLAAAGLVPDGREAAIVPFKGEAQAMPMVAGLIKTARNSGKIASLWAEVVYEEEEFRIWIEEGERKFQHDYDPLSRSGQIKGAYAVAKLTDGTVDMEPMSFEEIEKRRKASANQRGKPEPAGIWEKWYGEMAKKTVIRSLCKRLPMSADDMARLLVEQDPLLSKDVTPESDGQPRQTLAQRIADQTPPPEPEDAPDAPVEPEVTTADPTSPAYEDGRVAFEDGKEFGACPFDEGSQEQADWQQGWVDVEKEAKGE